MTFPLQRRSLLTLVLSVASLCGTGAHAQTAEKVVDIPTRPGVTQRFIYIAPAVPKASVILLAGGQGAVLIADNGFTRSNNFLVRSRQQFAAAGLAVAVVDAPSDRQSPPYLGGVRQTAEHVADVGAVIAWMRQQSPGPVWLVGTSRGTQSAAYVGTRLPVSEGGPDGIVLTSTILSDKGTAVPQMPLERLQVPVLVVHHEQDGCANCNPADLPKLMDRLGKTPVRELITFTGGYSKGDPCDAWAHHGYNGIEGSVVTRITDWLIAHP